MYSDLRESLHRIQSLSWPKLKQIIRIRPSSGIVDMMMQYTIFKSFMIHNKNNIIKPTTFLGSQTWHPHWELPTHCSPKFPLKLIKTSPPASTRTTPPVCLTSMLGVGECEAGETHIKSMVSWDLTSILRCQTVIFRSMYIKVYIIIYNDTVPHGDDIIPSFVSEDFIPFCYWCSWLPWAQHPLRMCTEPHSKLRLVVGKHPVNPVKSVLVVDDSQSPFMCQVPLRKFKKDQHLLHNNVWLAWSGGELLINALRKL